MQLPALLSRRNSQNYKNDFGHVLILAGSKTMLGAAALSSLAAMRSGAGLVTVGIPETLNSVIQKKISNVVMTLPLTSTKEETISFTAVKQVQKLYEKFNVIAIGPGLSLNPSTQKFILKIIATSPQPLVIDADALNALCKDTKILTRTKTPKILTPHIGEMMRLTKLSKNTIELKRREIALDFAKKYQCTLLLKGSKTIVASKTGDIYINSTGNVGMATAGSGDVLTGMIAAFLAQGLTAFEATKWGAYLHGKAGDLAAKNKTKLAMISSDIIDYIPPVVKGMRA